MAYLVDIQTTSYYRTIVTETIKKIREEFYWFMEHDIDGRKNRMREIINDEFDHWQAWCVVENDDFREQIKEIKALILQDVMTAFLEDLQVIVSKILGLPLKSVEPAAAPVSTPEPVVPPVAPVPEPAVYPAPDANSMALDPINAAGVEIPPLQTRNFYTIPKAERAHLMPTVSVDADDNSWLNNSVYNKGD